MLVIVPFIIMHWSFFIVILVPSFFTQVPLVVHTVPSPMVMSAVMSIFFPSFIMHQSWAILPECILVGATLLVEVGWVLAKGATPLRRRSGRSCRRFFMAIKWGFKE